MRSQEQLSDALMTSYRLRFRIHGVGQDLDASWKRLQADQEIGLSSILQQEPYS